MLDVAAEELEVDARRPRDRRHGQHQASRARRREVDPDRRPRARRPLQARPHDLRPRHVPQAERSYPVPETGADGPATLPGARLHGRRGRGRRRDRRGRRSCRMHNVYEVGRAINPAMVEQQIDGGAWMGMSHALFETTEPYYPDRDHGPRDFSEYLMPGPARHRRRSSRRSSSCPPPTARTAPRASAR